MDISLAAVTTGNTVIDSQSQGILKKFHWAIKKVVSEHSSGNNDTTLLTQEELIELIRAWEPKRDIICLYVRWARQLRRNFNLDSIATLLCMSRQCGYSPVDFIRKVKTLSVRKKQKSAYGVTFHFEIPNRKDLNRERLNKEFQGLSVTLALLQEQVTDSPSVLGKTGMRQATPRTNHAIKIPVHGSNQQHPVVLTPPNIEFHTHSSLLNRIWISINHRWLVLYMTEHLFREVNGPWSYADALVYSFQMMAPCGPGRYEFLSPLVGYCLRFPTLESIESKRSQLREIWKDPATFLLFGNNCLRQVSIESRTSNIITCFRDLRCNIGPTCNQITYHRDCSLLRRWTILRAYVFHFWLDSTTNSAIKSNVISGLFSDSRTKKRKNPGLLCNSDMINQGNSKSTTSVKRVFTPNRSMKQSDCGFLSITTSRRCASGPTNSSTTKELSLKDAPSNNSIDANTVDQTACQKAVNVSEKDLKTMSINDIQWASLRLITAQELKQFIESYLLIHRLDGVDILSELSPFEVYSANHLHDLSHCRLTGKSPFSPKQQISDAVLHVRAGADYFLDTPAKSFHVAREQSGYFQEHSHHLPSLQRIQALCRAIVSHGSKDIKRAMGQYRVNIGNGGQNWVDGAPCKLHGVKFQRDLENDKRFDATDVLQSIGQLTEFTWLVACSLQHDAGDHPIAPDPFRQKLYAASLCEYLKMDQFVGFEDLTLVVSSLSPVIHEVSEHKDTMNDTLAGYTRTAAFNLVMIDTKECTPTILHLQLICNFRKVIGHYVVRFHKYLASIARHARQYMDKWHQSVSMVYGGKAEKLPTIYDRSTFFLDDTLEYSDVCISEAGKHKQTITAKYILMEVNLSRTLSLSMFIDPIVKLQRFLKFDQTMELALAASFLSNPFWFEWTLSTLIQRLEDPNDYFQFQLHPFYDWSNTTLEIFGSWQGGPHNRWSPCGGKESVLETFGAEPKATTEERRRGEERLCRVISILVDHVEWINSLHTCGNMPLIDMPLDSLKAKCNNTIKEISAVAPCQFSHFRLGILTTILSGSGLLKPGKHLRNLMYPVKGSASYKHLCCPVADVMSKERARALGENDLTAVISNDGEGKVAEDHHDLFMLYLSAELGFKVFVRDEIECILCESHPMRILNCRDWFRKGTCLYDCNERGENFCRKYGNTTGWERLHPPEQYEFAYLGQSLIQYIPLDPTTSHYAYHFGAELRSDSSKEIRTKGRRSKVSGGQRSFTNTYHTKDKFYHPSIRTADFYLGSYVDCKKLQSMFVLDDAEYAVETMSCNNVEDYEFGKLLHSHLLTLPISKNLPSSPMAAACFHMDSETNNSEITFFQGHLDKPFVNTAWFVPIGTSSFFTVLSVPDKYKIIQDQDSLNMFNEWKGKLSTNECCKVDEFLHEFDSQSRKHMRNSSLVRLIYLNKCGSVLSFPANSCYHATITPQKPKGFPRDLFIFHPLDGIA